MRGVFVTGTDTDIGKTLVSAWLTIHWKADYWKPLQTGAAQDSDGGSVARLAPGRVIHPSNVVLQAPLSPYEAARREGVEINLATLTPPATDRPLVIEGAGGVLVPINGRDLMVDLIAQIGLPALVVARSSLGTVNHTLLTLEALRRHGVSVAGVVLNGQLNPANRHSIEHFGKVPVLAELQPLPAVTAATVAAIPPPSFLPFPQQGVPA